MARRRKNATEIDQRSNNAAERKADVVPLTTEEIQHLQRQFAESFQQPLPEKEQPHIEKRRAGKRSMKK